MRYVYGLFMMNNSINQLICPFCQEACSKMNKERKRRWWWECNKCKTQFMSSLKGMVEMTKFRSPGIDKYYSLLLDHKSKTTRIDLWERSAIRSVYKKDYYDKTKVIELPHLINNLTPDNAPDKMKLYILFS